MQHHGAVDEEPDGDQRHGDDEVVRRELPVEEDEHRDDRHEEDGRQGAASVEYLVREPSADQRAGDGGEFVGEIGPAGLLDVVALRVAEVGRRPVETSVAHHVDEGVGDGDEPQ